MNSRTINQCIHELADRVEETTGPATTWETAEVIFGEESLGLSGSPFVEPLEPVAAIAVGT
jgi:hypothetical protein